MAEPRTARMAQIVAAGRELLEADGPEALSMRAVADRLGIRAPSLYKHLRGKDELEAAIVSDGLAEVADAFELAASEPDPLVAVGTAYRTFALAHPHLYRLTNDRPLRRDLLEPGVEDRAGSVVVAACGGDVDRARAAFAFAHGMVSLELNDRFPPGADLDAAWRAGIDAFRPS